VASRFQVPVTAGAPGAVVVVPVMGDIASSKK
jgi:hypothetical protein